jgi:hypothetical protein
VRSHRLQRSVTIGSDCATNTAAPAVDRPAMPRSCPHRLRASSPTYVAACGLLPNASHFFAPATYVDPNETIDAMTRPTTARLAGLLYFATLPTAGFAYGFTAFMPKNDPAALLAALDAGRQTLGWTVLLGAAGFVDYLLMAALFHRLLAPAGKVAADLLVLFVTASVPLALAALACRLELMTLLDARSTDLLSDVPRLLRQEANLFQFATIFWGLWMIPLGWLSYRSGLVPKLIGIGLVLGSAGYLSGFVLPTLGIVPPAAVSGALMAVTLTSEFAFMFWLMVKGAKPQHAAPATALT